MQEAKAITSQFARKPDVPSGGLYCGRGGCRHCWRGAGKDEFVMFWILETEADVLADAFFEGFERWKVTGFEAFHTGDQLVEGFGADGFDELLFVLEIEVNRRRGVLDFVGHLA